MTAALPVEEFALVGGISGKHIPVSKADAERIAARGDNRVVRRMVSEWLPIEVAK